MLQGSTAFYERAPGAPSRDSWVVGSPARRRSGDAYVHGAGVFDDLIPTFLPSVSTQSVAESLL